MAIPDYQTLMLPVLRCLSQHVCKTDHLVNVLADEYGLSDEERAALLPGGGRRTIANRTHWALAQLNRAGLIKRIGAGEYQITDRGGEVLANPPQRITMNFLNQFPGMTFGHRSVGRGKLSTEPSSGLNGSLEQHRTPDEIMQTADDNRRNTLAAELLSRVRKIAPSKFEQLVIDLLVKMGYAWSFHQSAAERLGRPGDGGFDGVIRADPLGLDVIYVQAKRYGEDNAVGPSDIQSFFGAVTGTGATKGVFVTTSRFTQQACAVVRDHKSPQRIVLIDGNQLVRLMFDHEIGIRIEETIPLHRIDLASYEDEDVL